MQRLKLYDETYKEKIGRLAVAAAIAVVVASPLSGWRQGAPASSPHSIVSSNSGWRQG